MAAVLACTVVFLITRWLERRQTDLAPAVAEYEQAQAQIGSTTLDVQRLQKANQGLAEAIAGVRSGSALLTELSRVIPRPVQLTKLKVQSSSLELSGTVLQPLGLDVINSFQLRLEASPFFQSDGVSLIKAVEVPASTPAPPSAAGSGIKPPVLLNFDLTASFTSDVAKITAQQLAALGSLGSARRRELLQREGLLK